MLQPTFKNILRKPLTGLVERTTLPLNFRLLNNRAIFNKLRAVRHINIYVIGRPFAGRRIPRRRRNNNRRLTRINTRRMFNILQSRDIIIRAMNKGPSSNIIRRRASRNAHRRSSSLRPSHRVIAVLRRRLRAHRVIRGRKSSRESNNDRRIIRIRCTRRRIRSAPIGRGNSGTCGTRLRRLFGRFSREKCSALLI